VLAAAILWSLNGALIKLIDPHDAGATAIAFYRSLFAGLFLLPFVRVARFRTLRPRNVTPSRWPIRPAAASCVVFFTLMTLCFVTANVKTEAANAIILQYTSTFWIFLLSPLVLKERPTGRAKGVLVMAMIGIAVIFAGEGGTDMGGLLIALASGLSYGLLIMMIRQMRDSDAGAITVVNCLGSALLLLPVLLIGGGWAVSGRSFALLVFMGVVQFGLPYYLVSLGLRRVPAYQAALITLCEPVLNPLWALLAVGEGVSGATAIGGGVIVLALILHARQARRAAVQRRSERAGR
jgi:drug/metabolite transporter (DMT)-like permease